MSDPVTEDYASRSKAGKSTAKATVARLFFLDLGGGPSDVMQPRRVGPEDDRHGSAETAGRHRRRCRSRPYLLDQYGQRRRE